MADAQGYRWLDAVWEWARLVAEIDGRWHVDVRAWWADMQRDNALTVDGYRVLRFPSSPRNLRRADGAPGVRVQRLAVS